MLFAFALLAAAMPSMPAMVRARWTELYRDMPKLNKAFTARRRLYAMAIMKKCPRTRSIPR